MANNTYLGTATAVAQVDTFTPATVTTADINVLTLKDANGNTLAAPQFVIGGTQTAAACVTSLIAAWNGNTTAAAKATASGTTTLLLTAVTAGTAFYVTSSVTGTGTLTRAATTANAGVGDWRTPSNWFTGSAPATGDTVNLDANAAADIVDGLDQSAVDTITLNVTMDFVRSLGTTSAGGINSVSLKTGNNWVINYGLVGNGTQAGQGSPRFKVNHGSNTATWTIYNSGSVAPTDTGRAALQITGGSNTSKLYIVGPARVDVAAGNGETASLSVVGNSGGSSNVIVGSGTTLLTGDCSAGTTVFNCAMTTLSTTSGSAVATQGSGAIATASIGSAVKFNSTGTISTLNTYAGSNADFSGNLASRNVSTLNQYKDSKVTFNPSNPAHLTVTTHNKIGAGVLALSA